MVMTSDINIILLSLIVKFKLEAHSVKTINTIHQANRHNIEKQI